MRNCLTCSPLAVWNASVQLHAQGDPRGVQLGDDTTWDTDTELVCTKPGIVAHGAFAPSLCVVLGFQLHYRLTGRKIPTYLPAPHSGWLGVKHQITLLLFILKPLFSLSHQMWNIKIAFFSCSVAVSDCLVRKSVIIAVTQFCFVILF